MVNSPLIRPYLLGGVALGGLPEIPMIVYIWRPVPLKRWVQGRIDSARWHQQGRFVIRDPNLLEMSYDQDAGTSYEARKEDEEWLETNPQNLEFFVIRTAPDRSRPFINKGSGKTPAFWPRGRRSTAPLWYSDGSLTAGKIGKTSWAWRLRPGKSWRNWTNPWICRDPITWEWFHGT